MALSSELVSQLAKLMTGGDDTKSTDNTIKGTVVRYDGKLYVKLDGSDLLTPVQSTSTTKDGDRVNVTIQNHTATITGNISDPSASSATVEKHDSKISEFDVIVSYKVTTEELEAINATIDSLSAKVANIDELNALVADIENLKAKFAEFDTISAEDAKILNAEIENLEVKFGEFTDLSTEDLEAINAYITDLKGYTADFTYLSADVLEVIKANIKELQVKKLDAESAKITYANIDFGNIGEAAIKKLFADSGIIKDIVVSEGHITGELVGVTIKGDLIEAGTLKADRLVIKGSDGNYYKLNTDFTAMPGVEPVEEDAIHGSVLIAESITAEKIAVDDLVAFDATIGGFHITEDSIYSGVKSSVNNTTSGIYLDNEGQVAFGDSNNFLKYYKTPEGLWKLELAASSVKLSTSNKTVEESIQEVQKEVNKLKDEITTLLRIESSRGTVFKNDHVATVLSVVIYHGTQRITDSATMKSVFGESAYLQWYWQRIDDETYGVLSSSDSRFGDNGFTFTLSPEDVDTKVTFMCELIT